LEQGIIIPSIFDFSVPPKVAAAVAQCALDTGEARRRDVTAAQVAAGLEAFLSTGEFCQA
jgi:malic enzyme